jgi:dGTPase
MLQDLAGYAVGELNSRGRQFAQDSHPYRTGFARDRDRIVHCSAFRRLEGKTQVFMPGLDDHYRTRMTHSIEVSQIGRTIATALRVNEALTEAICLVHDLGHPPFGHAGESVLNGLMADFGGFEHNQQSLRVVDLLEHPYPDFAGLNLMYETRLGLARHRTGYDRPVVEGFGEANCSLEGQAAVVADRIAYNCHDLEDALRAGLIEEGQLKDLALWTGAAERLKARLIEDAAVRQTRLAKVIVDELVSDAIATSRRGLAEAGIQTVQQVYQQAENLIVLSAEAEASLGQFERFLLENVYRHSLLRNVNKKVAGWVRELFRLFTVRPELMAAYFQRLIEQQGLERTVCDYIAGMTNRYCLKILKESVDSAFEPE